ncbi:MAG: acetate kinase, partial [Lentisphaeria bacterium]|nr:acetate kinase [Lentisphaeria bacterium]
MKILVLNAGSSSLKFTLFDMQGAENSVIASGQVERVGSDKPNVIYKRPDGFKAEHTLAAGADHAAGLQAICDELVDAEHGVLKSLSEVAAIGHRVLHGGEKVTQPVEVT